MKVYIIYSVFFDPQEYKYKEPPGCYIFGVYSDPLTAFKLACAKQMAEYIEKEYCIPEFPDYYYVEGIEMDHIHIQYNEPIYNMIYTDSSSDTEKKS